ncbi:cellulose-binding domain-containing protein [Glycomyces sp. A-F 0318]|uniref:DUF6055 domain-containing protein n=1 Tax=Glycomyces amatae TaxID=2881355 RepID=UPI001E405B66|nr:DUF6055 domain-containing protein [Glycomyces amatae]MCD0444123.1 cellulose-binding domain-containing protein [Glycomyces amatae]
MEVTRSRRRRLGAVGLAAGALMAASAAVVAAVPASAAVCDAVQYSITSQWGTGHNAAVSIKAGSEPIDGWTVEFDLPAGSTVQNAWNVEYTQSGQRFRGEDAGWNAQIGAGQTKEVFGMTVTGTGTTPTAFAVNGVDCGEDSVPTTEPTEEPTGEPSQQKQTRTPAFLIEAGAETDNYVESENFTVRWGDAVDAVAWGRQRGYDNYPQWVADHMEEIYDYYVDEVGFVDPADHDLGSRYRINLYLCGTWSNGFLPPANWAGPDETGVGHICMPYDKTWDDWVESHEFNHILQSYASDINADDGNGGGWGHGNPVAGPVWEAHANYMARMQRPDVVLGSGYYLERQHFRWLAQETYYGDWLMFDTIAELYGPEAVDRLWFEAEQGEHPIDTIKRVLQLDHAEFAALIGEMTSRQVVYDFDQGQAMRSDLWRSGGSYRPLHTDALQGLGSNRYRIAASDAPHQYGHNIIRLNPTTSDVSVQLAGASNLSGADWRFRLVAVKADFSVRYSDFFSPGQTANFSLQSGETHMMLVVAATPSQHRNYTMWEVGVGDPFPYELTINGATPS